MSASLQYFILYNTLLILVLINFFKYSLEKRIPQKNDIGSYFLLIFMILIIGIRDWRSPDFGDSATYGYYFKFAITPESVWYARSKLFAYIYYLWNSLKLSPELFFICSACIYCLPMFFLSKKLSGEYSSYLFLLFFACSFGWYSFGVNGIRNGWAFAMMILSLYAYYDKKYIITVLFCILAWMIHGSSMIAIGGFIAASIIKSPKIALICWICCVVISLSLGTWFQDYFASFDFINKDGGDYLSGSLDDNESMSHRAGFRWDFLLYSLVPILWGIYSLKKYISINTKNINYYRFILCVYTYANAAWVLAIRASYSNRLAQCSWWMIPIIMAFPLYKLNAFKKKYAIGATLLLLYYGFTYIMYLRG